MEKEEMNTSKKPTPSAAPTRPELPVITERAILEDLARTVKSGFEKQANQFLELSDRQTKMEAEFASLRDRVARASERARGPSSHDLDAQRAIADEVLKREELARDVAETKKAVEKIGTVALEQSAQLEFQNGVLRKIEDAAVSFWTSPRGRLLTRVFWAAVALWAAKNNIHFGGP